MSTLWTPGGERPVPREPAGERPEPREPAGGRPVRRDPGGESEQPSEEELQSQMADLRDRLARTPAEVVIANHAYGLFELAALHLSLEKPQLDQARLAIDALGYLVEGMGKRLGEGFEELTNGLSNLRLAFVQVQAADEARKA